MKRHITCNDPAVAWITIMSGWLKCWTETLINSASAKAQGHISVFCTVVQRNIKLISFAEGVDQDGSARLPPESESIGWLPSAVVSLFTAVQLSLVGHQERRASCLFPAMSCASHRAACMLKEEAIISFAETVSERLVLFSGPGGLGPGAQKWPLSFQG